MCSTLCCSIQCPITCKLNMARACAELHYGVTFGMPVIVDTYSRLGQGCRGTRVAQGWGGHVLVPSASKEHTRWAPGPRHVSLLTRPRRAAGMELQSSEERQRA